MKHKLSKFFLVTSILYFGVTAVFLNLGPLTRLINTDPEEVRVLLDYAFSPLPGLVYVKGIKVRIQDSNMQMHIDLKKAWVFVNVFALPQRKFNALWVKGKELDFRLRFLKSPRDFKPSMAKNLPPIPGFPGFLKPVFQEEDLGPSNSWKIRIQNVSVNHIEKIWFEEYHFQGLASVKGGFYLWPGNNVFIDPAVFTVEEGLLSVGKYELMSPIKLTLNTEMKQFSPKKEPGLNPFNYINAELDINSSFADLRFLNYYLSSISWLKFKHGSGNLSGRIKVIEGKWAEMSSLGLHFPRVSLELLASEVTSQAEIKWEIKDKKHALSLLLENYAFYLPPEASSKIKGDKMHLFLSSPELKIANTLSPLSMRLTMQNASIENMDYYNLLLPQKSGLRLLGGKGTFDGYLALSTDETISDEGKIELKAKNIRLINQKKELQTDLTLTGKLNHGKISSKGADIAGSSLNISNLINKSENQPPWAGVVTLVKGTLKIDKKPEWKSNVLIRGSDARILSYLILSPNAPKLVKNLFNSEGLNAVFDIELNDEQFTILDLRGNSGHTQITGWLNQSEPHLNATALVKYPPFSVGFSIKDDSFNLRLQNAEEWYKREKAHVSKISKVAE